MDAARGGGKDTVADAIVSAAREIAETTNIKAICCFSESGTTAALTARERPHLPIVALSSRIRTARRMTLSWGVHCVVVPEVDRFKSAVVAAIRVVREHGIATENDQIVVTAGIPFNQPGTTNILRVAPCQERLIFASEPE
jgi:pyruvate kinase